MLFKQAIILAGVSCAVASRIQLVQPPSSLSARHHGDHPEDEDHDHSSEDDHSHSDDDDDHDHSSGGHDHSSSGDAPGAGSYGPFNFTATGVDWPQCLQGCVHANLDYISEPVNHPLCVNERFYQNVTGCVVNVCVEYEQGAFAAVLEDECPDDEDFTADAVRATMTAADGNPQECETVDNSTIRCDNGTAEGASGGDDEGLGVGLGVKAQTWVLGAVMVALPAVLML
jgi:hypothetical protein